MMVHSNVFGKCENLGEKNLETELYSVINVLANYTNTKKIKIIVTDEKGKTLSDATVKFKLYNYAEYYPLASVNTDKNGIATLTTGYGDLLVWASKNGKYGYRKFDVRENDELVITVENEQGKVYTEWLEIHPPEAGTHKKTATQEQNNINNKRLQYEDSLRNAYRATFMSEEEAKTIQTETLTTEQLGYFIHKSEGNYAEIKKFIEQNNTNKEGLFVYEFLKALSDKDLRDAPADILQTHITIYHPDKYPFDVYLKGIIPARIANEGLRFWRNELHDNLKTELGEHATYRQLIHWIHANIALRLNDNYYRAPISPKGVYDLKLTDKHSLNIFFVAACRAMNIPAYLDGATNLLFVWENGKWEMVNLEKEENIAETKNTLSAEGKLVLHLPPGAKKPEYWVHYTIAKFVDGDFVTFDYEDDPRVANFPATLKMEPGYYMLSTGNRYHDGETLSQLEFFNIEHDKTINKTITWRELTPRNKNYGNIDINSHVAGLNQTLIELIPDKELLLCFIDPTREPTIHLLNDIVSLKKAFEKWNGNILFFIPSEKNTAGFDPKRWNLPKNTIISIDEDTLFLNYILTATNQYFREEYPLVFIVDKKGELVFKSEGYRIGTGELLLKSLK